MWKCCELAQRHGFPVYLYGSTEQTLARLGAAARRRVLVRHDASREAAKLARLFAAGVSARRA